ncbi:MAG: thymidylate synthase (FAD) [Proteobacteria bacterium]|uniref:Thymidylate synthase (FAD) n=1 Tax=Candidatus Fonsibacter lacus TaxID=2576439 RepID=A0A964UY17_9PROT|nr:thymidylate synthase (FAD) [Candidatus Fonsibacter lacus]
MELTSEQKKEIQEQQSQSNSTKRVTSPELEKVLYEAIPVLDHGFIRVIDYMGDDSSIVQSARVSYGKGTKKVSTDEGLIKYLMRHRHSTPFEMCEIKYHVKLPIFIARQWTKIDENKVGLARELARMNLTLNTYTQWYWKTDLLNLLNFLFLRADNHAQYEIRVYADKMLDTVKKWVPITYQAFMDYRVGAAEISSKGLKVIKSMISGKNVGQEESGLSKREWNELMEKLDKKDLIVN